MDKLTAKQRAWIDYYKQGKTATEAARLAGYKPDNAKVIGAQNLTKLNQYISDRDELLDRDRVADMAEINAFWSDTMRDDTADIKDRLKASELRARSTCSRVTAVQVCFFTLICRIDFQDLQNQGFSMG